MKKMLYVMNVEWNWIKQRPHFIAEELNEVFDMTIIYQYRYGRSGLQKRDDKHLKLKPAYLIPKLSGIGKLKIINEILLGLKVKHYIKEYNPEFLYLTYPSHIHCVPKDYRGKVIYDCMDDHTAFMRDEESRKKLAKQEGALCERSDYIFVTSENLMHKSRERYNLNTEKVHVVRNAYDGKIIEQKSAKEKESKLKLAYIGTISNWFDFAVIQQSLEKDKNIEYYLYGPIDGVEIPNNDRIKYMGTVEHSQLYAEVKDKDVLLMPFVLNEIIEAVDPVKLYEYINFNKDILCVKYKEIERFEEFVYFYNSIDEYMDSIDKIRKCDNVKYSLNKRKNFLKENSWNARATTIVDAISKE